MVEIVKCIWCQPQQNRTDILTSTCTIIHHFIVHLVICDFCDLQTTVTVGNYKFEHFIYTIKHKCGEYLQVCTMCIVKKKKTSTHVHYHKMATWCPYSIDFKILTGSNSRFTFGFKAQKVTKDPIKSQLNIAIWVLDKRSKYIYEVQQMGKDSVNLIRTSVYSTWLQNGSEAIAFSVSKSTGQSASFFMCMQTPWLWAAKKQQKYV